MAGHVYKPYCKCKDAKKCTCNATWTYIIDLGRKNPKTGRRWPYKKSGFRTKKEAEAAMSKLVTEVTEGTFLKESSTTFGEFAPEWKAHYSATNGVKEGTLRIRQNEINNLNKYFEFIPMKDIKKRDYQSALNDLKLNGYSGNTISGINATAGMIFKLAIEWKLIKEDPSDGARIPKDKVTVEELENKEEIPKYLEKEELALFLKFAEEKGLDNDYEIFMTLAYTGMRVGELCALKSSDLKSDEETISITKTLYNPTNNRRKYKLGTPKTKKSIRNIVIDNELVKILNKVIAKQKAVKMKYRTTYHDKGFIFAYSEKLPGYPYYIKRVENRMARLLKLSGLNQDLTPHSLRHTHVSLLAEAGVSLPDIMDRLGHGDDNITRNIYLHVTKTKKKEASQKFSELMRSL